MTMAAEKKQQGRLPAIAAASALVGVACLVATSSISGFGSPSLHSGGKDILPLIAGSSRVLSSKGQGGNDAKSILEFVHIPKTGGTAIERAGGQVGISWGACRFLDLTSRYEGQGFGPGCFGPKDGDDPESLLRDPNTLMQNIAPWHTPPHWFLPNLYGDRKTFAIVRDPFAKMVSTYRCKYHGYKGRDKEKAANLNKWVIERLRPLLDELDRVGREKEPTLHYPGCAFLPQVHYIYDHHTNEQKQMVDHILKYEALDNNFAHLMSDYGLNATLNKEKTNAPVGGGEKLSTKDLSQDAKDLIRVLYAADFKAFGYPTEVAS